MYGADHKTPTAIVAIIRSLEGLACRCCHPFRRRTLAGSLLVAVPGERRWRWQSATALAGRYPDKLVRKWVGLLGHDGRIEVRAATSLALETEVHRCLEEWAVEHEADRWR